MGQGSVCHWDGKCKGSVRRVPIHRMALVEPVEHGEEERCREAASERSWRQHGVLLTS